MLESIYRAAGLRVGLFTSPHLVAFGERIQVNRRLISEGGIARLAAEMQVVLERLGIGRRRSAELQLCGNHGTRRTSRGEAARAPPNTRPF